MTTKSCETCENYKPVEKKSLLNWDCSVCAVEECPSCRDGSYFIQRNCGNCGWHGEHKYNNPWAKCTKIGVVNTVNRELMRKSNSRYNTYCSWKPIPIKQEKCEVCGGHGVVCSECGQYHPSVKRNHPWDDIPCPACSSNKEEKGLVVPVRWIKSEDTDIWCLINDIMELRWGILQKRDEGFKINFFHYKSPCHRPPKNKFYSTLDQAKQAVERALNIREG